jgi:hypothetical protein
MNDQSWSGKKAKEPCPSKKDKGKRIRDKPLFVTRDRAQGHPSTINPHYKIGRILARWSGSDKGILKGGKNRVRGS